MVQYRGESRADFPANRNADSAGKEGKRVPAIFFRTEAGGEPVREWLRSLSQEDRKRIGEDIKSVEYGWPVGMPVCRPLGNGICEVRTMVTHGRIARVLFYIDKKGRMVLLHGLIKKTRKRRMMTWRWREATRVSIKGDWNERKEESQAV
jgi:phage-related protein